MFYEPDKRNHGLPRDPFKALVVPRPIGWISTVDIAGRPNLAPYSFYNAVASDPPVVLFGTGLGPGRKPGDDAIKDSQRNAEATGEFVVNMVTDGLLDAMNRTSAHLPHGSSEFEAAGLETVPSQLVRAPRVKASPVHLECRYLQTVEMPCTTPGGRNFVVFGRVVGIHIDERVLKDGFVDISLLRPLARLGYMEYCLVDKSFSLDRPD